MTSALPSPRHPLVHDSILTLVGNTSLVELARVGAEAPRARLFAKVEAQNPGGSVKDRICLRMVEEAERAGALAPGGTVIEPTSGNTGIGLALVAARKGYRCLLTMPESMSLERRQLLAAYGAEVVLTPDHEQMEGAIARARALQAELPGSVILQQFENPANPEAHEHGTGPELLRALDGLRLDAFVAAVGTGGTITGVGRVLRRERPGCRIIAVEPETSATLSRGERGPSKIQGIAAGFVPRNFDAGVPHEIRTVRDEVAWRTKQELARREGLLVGISAGANVAVALEVARELGPEHVVATMLCDTGERYFSLDDHFLRPAHE